MTTQQPDRRRIRAATVTAILLALGLLLTQCPAYRDGAPGVLAAAMSETTSAVRSAALALDLRIRDRSTARLAAVQISDAGDELVGAYSDIAELRIEDPADLERQHRLAEFITTARTELGRAAANLHNLDGAPRLPDLRDRLLALADELQSGYR